MELFEASTGFQLFVDMDGVLVDFDGGVDTLGAIAGPRDGYSDFWKILHGLGPEEVENWWANLGWAPGGQILWNFVKKYDPTILSSPDISPGFQEACEAGKKRWIKKNLNPFPPFIFEKQKWMHASKFGILIDDTKKKLIPWEEHGGSGIFYQTGNPTSAIKELVDRFGFPRK